MDHLWSLLGIAVVVLGFLVRLNPLLVVVAAALTTGIASGHSLGQTVEAFGKAFTENRYVSVLWLILPLIGLLERQGLQERARQLIGRVRAATAGRLLVIYLLARQVTAAVGLTSLGGHAQMVRPLIAPMAEAAAETELGGLPDKPRQTLRAFAASADNIGLFFGEDIFIAISSILLIKASLETAGIVVAPLQLSLWAIPTAILAFLIHGFRLLRLDGRLKREAAESAGEAA
ncbi:MAG: rane protein [Caulobacter sp.]|nr:rane protein [Caulobacter sp.]